MLKFIGNSADGLPLKRKQSQRACETCRKRKVFKPQNSNSSVTPEPIMADRSQKRCKHLNGTDSDIPPIASWSDQTRFELDQPVNHHETSPGTAASSSASVPINASQTPNLSSRGVHFIPTPQHPDSFLGPNIVSPSIGTYEREDESHFVGDLNPQSVFLAATSPATSKGDDNVGIWLPKKTVDHVKSNLSRGHISDSHLTSLSINDPFISTILLPYLEEQCRRVLPKSADFDALRLIYTEEIHPILPIVDLDNLSMIPEASSEHIMLKQAICLAASTSPRAAPHLRISITSENQMSQTDFARQISIAMKTSIDLLVIKDAIILVQILTILSLFSQLSNDNHSCAEYVSRAISHLQTIGLHLNTDGTRKDHLYVTRLFCCVWSVDRLNAAFNGRPVLMHERDFARDMQTCIAQQDDCFQLFLRVMLLLDRVIQLYRPAIDGITRDWESDFPAFEDLVEECKALRVKANLVATIETLYHAVAMLSCRSQSLKESERSSPAYLRQNLAMSRIISIVGSEFQGQLSYLPVVPYAVSLSLKLSYRDLRRSKASFFRTRARKQLLNICTLLKEFGDTFSSSNSIVNLAEQTVRQFDKVASTMVSNQQNRMTRENTTEVQPLSSVQNTQDLTRPITDPSNINPPAPEVTIVDGSDPLFDGPDFNFPDPAMFDNLPDLDIFEHFDPDFDLDAIDAVLVDNIFLPFSNTMVDFQS